MRQSHLAFILKTFFAALVIAFFIGNVLMYIGYINLGAYDSLSPVGLFLTLVGWPVVVLLLCYTILDAIYRW